MSLTAADILGNASRATPVANTPELERVFQLPRRPSAAEVCSVDVAAWSAACALRPGPLLFPAQAQLLAEVYTLRGGVGLLAVGEGKTLVTALAPTVLGARRPMLLTLASLQEKTRLDFARYGREWRVSPAIVTRSYEGLGRPNGAQTLELQAPDLIMLDEFQRVKNVKAACTRRLARYLIANPSTMVIALSGTAAKAGLADFAHVLVWCLKKGAPVPIPKGEQIEWGEALDDQVTPGSRREPGALVRFTSPTSTRLEDVRRGYQARLNETPGVVASAPTKLGCSLIVEEVPLTPGPAAQAAFAELRKWGAAPDGYLFSTPIEMWACARQLAMGFCYMYDPRPPQTFVEARKAWAQFVRGVLERSRTLDSEATVRSAVMAGHYPEAVGILQTWEAEERAFPLKQKTVWLDSVALDASKAWLEKHGGIVWTEHTAFALRLAFEARVPYFGREGVDRTALNAGFIDTYRGGPCVASIRANSAGRNLQDRWSRGFVPSPPTNSKDWQQLIGRFHRTGQASDIVQFDIGIACAEHEYAIERSLAGAEMQRDLIGDRHKLLVADWVASPPRKDRSLPSMRQGMKPKDEEL